jgi:inorganic pyrophosphatase
MRAATEETMVDLDRADNALDARSATCRAILAEPGRERRRSARAGRLSDCGLARWLPDDAGFSLHLGFVPSTRGRDGDPLDILVVDAEPAAGSTAEVRLVGMLQADHTELGLTLRHDLPVAVARNSKRFSAVRDIDELGQEALRDVIAAWVAYNTALCASFRIVGSSGAADAVQLLRALAHPHAPAHKTARRNLGLADKV